MNLSGRLFSAGFPSSDGSNSSIVDSFHQETNHDWTHSEDDSLDAGYSQPSDQHMEIERTSEDDDASMRLSNDQIDFRSNHLWPLAVEAETVRAQHFGMILPKLRALLPTARYQQETSSADLPTDELPYSRSYFRLLVVSLVNGFAGLDHFPVANALKYLQQRFSGARLLKYVESMDKHACASFAQSLLQCAVQTRQPDIVDFLLSRKRFMVDVNCKITIHEYGDSLVTYAIRRGDAAVTKVLIHHGASVQYLDSPEAFRLPLLHFILAEDEASEASVEIAEILLHTNVSPDGFFRFLSWIKINERVSKVCELAVDKYAEASWQDCLRSGHIPKLVSRLPPDISIRIIQRLIGAGAMFFGNIDYPFRATFGHFARDPESTIDAAAKMGNLALVKLLQAHGANCTSATFAFAIMSGNSELVRVLCNENIPADRVAFQAYAQLSRKMIAENPYDIDPDIVFLLQEYNLIAPDFQGQLLNFLAAAQNGDITVLKSLLHAPDSTLVSAGVLSPRDNSTQATFKSALSLAMSGEHEEAALILLDAGARFLADSCAALHQALKMRSRPMVEACLRYRYLWNFRTDVDIFAAAMDWGERDIIIGLLSSEISHAQPDIWTADSTFRRLQRMIVSLTARAVAARDEEMVLILSEVLASLPLRRPFPSEPISIALQNRDESMLRLLLSRGFGLEYSAPILAACDHDLVRLFDLCQALDQRHVSCGKSLHDIALKHLIWRGNTIELTQFLELSGFRPDVRSFNMDGIEYLPFCLDFCAPLAVAVNADLSTRLASTTTMLKYGADPNGILLSQTMRNAKPQYSRSTTDQEHLTPLLQAIRNNDFDMVTLLIRFGADVNQFAKGMIPYTPLQQAVVEGSYEMTHLLLENGAEVNGSDSRPSTTALPLAAMRGYSGIVELLIEYGADVNKYDPSSKDETALRAAVNHGRLDVVRLLLDHGAALHCTEHREKPTPETSRIRCDEIQLAKLHGHHAIAHYLQVHGHSLGTQKVNAALENERRPSKASQGPSTDFNNLANVIQETHALDETMTSPNGGPHELHTTDHRCLQCGKVLSNASSLTRHIRSKHSDSTPFACNICSSTFKRRDLLQRHIMTTHANIGKVPCATCGNFFRRDYYHSTHLTADGRCRNRRTIRARKTLP